MAGAGLCPARGPRLTDDHARPIGPAQVFRLALLVVLWYQLAGLVFSRVLGVWPAGYEAEGFFIVAAALPWSLLALGFYGPTDAIIGAAIRDLLFFGLLALGIAANAAIAAALLGGLWRRLRLAGRIAHNDAATQARRTRQRARIDAGRGHRKR